ncbi:MAG: DNA repair protein RadA [Candidatus Dadabacteria bacterium]|nr:DNA repair protein RadA [Candidatus Dadabacteria bacterium]NIV42233.1 DNA repair protein RadA [Candidatus Dadabacteria bacterium]NIX15325.1 DNA repair protein RadA [Candidatus Dadabacteria bacterium]
MKRSKSTVIFVCQNCGSNSPRWIGKCPACSEWNTYVEELGTKEKVNPVLKTKSKPILIDEISSGNEERIKTEITEMDRVLGGGLISGSAVLIGGDPGIGKSTLALQIFGKYSENGFKVLYVTGEESSKQIQIRAKRLNIKGENLYVVTETNIDSIINNIENNNPAVVVIDSIQTIYSSDLPSASGSVGQIRECTSKVIQYAKNKNISFFLIGHVTKEGSIAGPKVLEHLVDTVLYFEGGKSHPYRILRAVKNRYGSTNEIGVFEMTNDGLKEVTNPSEIFLSERPLNSSGSIVTPSIEGTRPILVEIQALVSPCNFGVPRRTTIGLDSNRVSLLVAVLEKRGGLHITSQDIFMNVAGGVKLEEPAIDLGICMSLVSSFLNKPVSAQTIVFGEVGLSGEIRGVSQVDVRLKEAEKLGFKKFLLPKINIDSMDNKSKKQKYIGIENISQAIEILFE